MLAGKALVYAVIVSLINAVLIAALLNTLTQTEVITGEHLEQNRAIRNLQSGLEYILSLDSAQVFPKVIDLFDQHEDPVLIAKYNWGLYKVGYTRAWIPTANRKDTLSKAILIGHSGGKSLAPALFIADKSKTVFISGNTDICGDLFVPGGALQPGFASGNNFRNNYSIQGKSHASTMFLPDVRKEYLQEVKFFLDSIHAIPLAKGAAGGNSFYQPTVCYSGDQITLSNEVYKGNILLRATKRIRVEASCQLEDIILYAPEIVIEDGFKGRLQAIATQKIELGQNARLLYPSTVCLLRASTKNDTLSIRLNRLAKVEGCVLTWSLDYSPVRTQVFIAKQAQVTGQVFSDGWVDIQGAVWGNLTCAGLLYQTSVSYQENYLVDAAINRCSLGSNYAGPFFEKHVTKEQVLKWLY